MAAKQIQPLPIEPLLLKTDQAAALCGLSVSTWHEHRAAGLIPPSVKIGKARLWRLDILRKWTSWTCPTIDPFNQFLEAEGMRK